jgi:hypothetical protein
MKTDKKAPRLVARQFAKPLTQEEIDAVSGGLYSNQTFHPGPGTCTLNNDDD